MIELRPRETVLLAEDFHAQVAWYRDVLGFEVVKLFDDAFHFANLESATGIKLGIGSRGEMGVEEGDPATNRVVLQFEVDDLRAFFEYLEQVGARITGGPSFDSGGGFWFGSFADPEGNSCWVVDKDCP
jgi:predicted enzyme related to lactoylglutathione lyase